MASPAARGASRRSTVLDAAISKVRERDPDTAHTLEKEVRALRQNRRFGLVFERHLPELVTLPEHPVLPGCRVTLREHTPASKGEMPTWRVQAVEGVVGGRTVTALGAEGKITLPAEELVVVREFDEPIYPGLRSVKRIGRGRAEDPWHVVISGENHHTLQMLQLTHRASVDLIYIDPPYNTGNKGWIYNDRYVQDADPYKHSKWLSFMEKRLRLAHSLLSESGILMISIDDREQARLKLLSDQIFGEKQFVAQFAWKSDGNLDNQAKVKTNHEYVLLYARHAERYHIEGVKDPNLREDSKLFNAEIRNSVVKNGPKNPVSEIHLPAGFPASVANTRIPSRQDVWPHYGTDLIIEDHKLRYAVTAKSGWANAKLLRTFIANGFSPVVDSRGQDTRFELTRTGTIENVKERSGTQHHILTVLSNMGTTEVEGNRLKSMGLSFPYPKPTKLVEYLCSFAGKDAVILDFFGGSGTTLESVLNLNAHDGGNRQAILVTNNEIPSADAERLSRAGRRPGDPAWEAKGVFRDVTLPRISTVVTGERDDGSPYSEGLAANVEFFELTYLQDSRVRRDKEFSAVAPVLWLSAGARGERIDDPGERGWQPTPQYAVLADIDAADGFVEELNRCAREHDPLPHLIFIITGSSAEYAGVTSRLPAELRGRTHRLYDSYLRHFENLTGTDP